MFGIETSCEGSCAGYRHQRFESYRENFQIQSDRSTHLSTGYRVDCRSQLAQMVWISPCQAARAVEMIPHQAHQVPLTNPYPKGSAEVRGPVTSVTSVTSGSAGFDARPCDWMRRDLRWSGALVCRDDIWESDGV